MAFLQDLPNTDFVTEGRGPALCYIALSFVTELLRFSFDSELKDQRTHRLHIYLNLNIFCISSASSELTEDLSLISLFVAARGRLPELKLANAGTNLAVRRKTLFESAELADFLRKNFSSEWTWLLAQILRRRYFIFRIRKMNQFQAPQCHSE